MPRSRPPLTTLAAFCAVAFLPACGPGDGPPGRAAGERDILVERLVELDDGDSPILARPVEVSTDSRGRWFIADRSDKDIKVYGRDGKRILAVGRPGHGPGEFAVLLGAQTYRDSLAAFDVVGAKLNVFSPEGRYARSFSLARKGLGAPFEVRVVDDSLFLTVAALPGGEGGNLLALRRPDGSIKSTFFDQSRYFGNSPALIQLSGVVADAAHGVVFAAVAGADSVWAFDYAGHRLGAAQVDPAAPLVTTKSLLARNGGKGQRPDGSWVVDGNRMLFGMVALDSATVAMQVAPFDAKAGVDLIEGGTMIFAGLDADGGLRMLAREEVTGGLLGRDRAGAPLLVRYAGAEADRYDVVRIRLVPRATDAWAP
ncbi:MAG TPA: hypothetical protein VHG91_05110 [Longimicrobium sp.]|nr:hypothetical protein [Longimicrobium sp.]